MEDPSPEFQRIRDYVDCQRCIENEEVMATLKQPIMNGNLLENGPKLRASADFVNFRSKARAILKINRFQAKRLYELLRLYLLPRDDKSVKVFRDALEKRIHAFFSVCLLFLF